MNAEIDRLQKRICYCLSQECEEAIEFTGVGYQGEDSLVVFVSALTPAVETWRQNLGAHLSSRVATRKGNFIADYAHDFISEESSELPVDSGAVGLRRGSRVGGGSVGCFLLNERDERFLVSSQHSNGGVRSEAKSGSKVIGSVAAIGDLSDPQVSSKVVDAALIRLLNTTDDRSGSFCNTADRLTGRLVSVAYRDIVEKCGQKTSRTVGEVFVTEACVLIDAGGLKGVKFEHQIIVTNKDGRVFAKPGDSGSLVTKNGDAVGIWMGFDEDQEYFAVNPMDWVLCRLSQNSSNTLRIKAI
ncbi:MAG: hypothetical protein ABJC13_23175 [Acidobacteriota bacterium]